MASEAVATKRQVRRAEVRKMKTHRTVLAILVLLSLATASYAQQNSPASAEETVTIKKGDLTPEQLTKLEQGKIIAQLGEYKEYAEMGRGIGLAVGESLRSVKDVVVDFSQTDVGRFTLFLVAWKVMARDVLEMGDKVLGYVFGPLLLFVGGAVLIWSYRRQCLPRKFIVKKSKEETIYGWLLPNGNVIKGEDSYGSKYEVGVSRNIQAVWHAVLAALLVVFTTFITFGG